MKFEVKTEKQDIFVIDSELDYPLISEIKNLDWNDNGYIVLSPMDDIFGTNFLQIEIRSLNITFGIEINFKCDESYLQYQYTTTNINQAIEICSDYFYKHKIPNLKNWKYINKKIILENFERDNQEYLDEKVIK